MKKMVVHQADETSIYSTISTQWDVPYSTISTQWDVPGMTWTKLAEEAKRRGRPIIYWAVRNKYGDFQLMKFYMTPNGKTVCPNGGLWSDITMYVEYGTVTRRFLNYWLAWAYQLRLKQAHEEVK